MHRRTCSDWYSSMLIKYTINSDWKLWKKIFCETYVEKEWTSVRYAIEYKYINGPLLDYALKKRKKKLLEVKKSLEKHTLIELIAVGLPNYVCNKIDRNKLKETEDIFNELRSLEYLVKKTMNKKENLCNRKKVNQLKTVQDMQRTTKRRVFSSGINVLVQK